MKELALLDKVRDWFGFSPEIGHAAHGHHHGKEGGHGHTHGVIDPMIATTERAIWAIKCHGPVPRVAVVPESIMVYRCQQRFEVSNP